jgi:hypothetical protein
MRASFHPTRAGVEAGQSKTIRFARYGVTALFLVTIAAGMLGLESDTGNTGWKFHALITAFAVYLLLECLSYLNRAAAFGLLAPPFLASILHFYLMYIMPSTATLYDNSILDQFSVYLGSQEDQFADTVFYIALAAFCMWRGYYLAIPTARSIQRRLRASMALRPRLEPALIPVISLQVVYVTLVAFGIGLGVFGMASAAEAREENIELLDLINQGMQAGSLSLFLLLTYVFKSSAQGKPIKALAIVSGLLVVLHLFVGALSGFKNQLVMPFVMLAFAKFVATRKISLSYILSTCVALIVAYQVIEPFRAYLWRNSAHGSMEVASLIEALLKSQEERNLMAETPISLGAQIASRFDLTGMTAVGIAAAADGTIAEKGAEFAESLYLAPILAWVPRTLWPGKPTYHSGVWFSNVVLGHMEDTVTSVGMGPVTWLYMMGGVTAVAFGFLALGVLQCILFEGLACSGAGGFVVFLGGVMTLVIVPSDLGPAFTGLLRVLPLAALAQFILLRPGPH